MMKLVNRLKEPYANVPAISVYIDTVTDVFNEQFLWHDALFDRYGNFLGIYYPDNLPASPGPAMFEV